MYLCPKDIGMYDINSSNKDISRQNHHSLAKGSSTRERIMASTMSVDEYFDELIDQVREDYANL